MAQKRRITQPEWDSLYPEMTTFADITTEIGYAVLVQQQRQADVAAKLGRTKQNVANAVKRVWELYQQVILSEGEDLELVNVWLPKQEAIRVKEIAAKFSINKDKLNIN